MIAPLRTEQLLSFPAAAKLLTGTPNISTLHRWRLRGIRGIRLETWLVGGRRFTSPDALERFATAVSAVGAAAATPIETSAVEIDGNRLVDQQLDSLGL